MREDTKGIVEQLMETVRRLLLTQLREAERVEQQHKWQEENDALGGERYFYPIEFTEEWQ